MYIFENITNCEIKLFTVGTSTVHSLGVSTFRILPCVLEHANRSRFNIQPRNINHQTALTVCLTSSPEPQNPGTIDTWGGVA